MNKKRILRVQPLHLILIPAISFSIFTILMFIPNIAKWDMGDLSLLILWYFIFIVTDIFWIFLFFRNMQFAIIERNDLIIKKYIFCTRAKIDLENVKNITIERLSAQSNPGSPSLNWITIYTNMQKKSKNMKKYGRNKDCVSWRIIATKKNLEILKNVTVSKKWII